MMDSITSYLPSLLLVIGLSLGLWGTHWFLIARHTDLRNERKLPRHLIILALSVLSVLAIILNLPIADSSRNQLIAVIGLLVSGVIAFSSTNIIANLMGGLLLRSTKPFRVGDFIRVEKNFGRVTERGMFDTEIQTESRELVAIPNAYLISHPIVTTPSSGSIVSTSLSLGYDVHHGQAEPLLLSAAEKSGLADPFIHITEMGNYAVTYRVFGILEDTKRLITARSNLCRAILDTLHDNDIEIMSSSYMNQRPLGPDSTTIPPAITTSKSEETSGGERLAFDKADEAERKEKEKQQLTKDIQELEASLKEASEEDKARIKLEMRSRREQLKTIEESKSDTEPDLPEQTP